LDAVLTSDSPFVKDFKEYHTDTEVNFLLTVDANIIDEAHQGLIHKKLKLESQFSKNNLVAFDPHGKIKKYENANAILQEFFEVRLEFYKKRKAYLVEVYTREHERLSNKVRFVKAIISGDIILNNKPKKHLLEELNLKNYKKFNTKESEDNSGYNYLLSMPLWNLTAEKVQNLEDTMRQKTEELMLLIETSVNQLWRNDLAEFKAMYDELYSGRASETSSSSKGKVASISRTSVRVVTTGSSTAWAVGSAMQSFLCQESSREWRFPFPGILPGKMGSSLITVPSRQPSRFCRRPRFRRITKKDSKRLASPWT
jgi:DNA topoisomerase-2